MTPIVLAASLAAALAGDRIRELSDRADALLDRLYADPGNDGILSEAGVLRDEALAAGATGVAEKIQGQISGHRPASLDERHLYVRILLSRGRVAEAERDLRDLLRGIPTDCAGHRMLAELLRSRGDPRGAIAVHEAHLREHPDEAGPVHDVAALSLWDLRDPVAAREGAARMRAAAGGSRASPSVAAWLRENAAGIEEGAAALERDRAAALAAEERALRLSLLAAAAVAAALAAAYRLTVRTEPDPNYPT